jgi:peptidyl-prolyl cis-trans isomerase B (cyclophilin B)
MRYFTALFLLLLSISGVHANETVPRVELVTNQGSIVLALYSEQAPITVANFLRYAEEGFYDNTIFHRVIPDFMVQGGGYSVDFEKKPTHPPIQNEADSGLQNVRGTVAMSRTTDPHSATSQFFVNVSDNGFLDHQGKAPTEWGYAVFGQVIAGMDIVDKIQAMETGSVGPFNRYAPLELVIIEAVNLSEASADLISPIISEAIAALADEAETEPALTEAVAADEATDSLEAEAEADIETDSLEAEAEADIETGDSMDEELASEDAVDEMDQAETLATAAETEVITTAVAVEQPVTQAATGTPQATPPVNIDVSQAEPAPDSPTAPDQPALKP